MSVHTAFNSTSQVRISFLSQLLPEASAYLHSFLTASVLNKKIFQQPFHRDVQITPEGVSAMRASLAYCQQVMLVSLLTVLHFLDEMLKGILLVSCWACYRYILGMYLQPVKWNLLGM